MDAAAAIRIRHGRGSGVGVCPKRSEVRSAACQEVVRGVGRSLGRRSLGH